MSALPWFRLYTEFCSDPKIQILAFEDQRHFVMLLCLKGNGTLDTKAPHDYRERLIAKALGLDVESAKEARRRLVEAGLVDRHWQPLKWEERQRPSDFSVLRVRKHREKLKGNGDVTLHETLQTRSRVEEIRKDQKESSPINGDSDPRDIFRRLVATDGKERTPRAEAALRKIGGWSRIKMRTDFDTTKIEREFCTAYPESA